MTSSGTLALSVTGTNGSFVQQNSAIVNSTDSATLQVAGNGTINLSNNNTLSYLAVYGKGNITVNDLGGLTFYSASSASNLTGNLTLTTTGQVSNHGAGGSAITNVGTFTISNGSSPINFNTVTTNNFDTIVILSSGAVTIVDSNGINLGNSSGGNINATSLSVTAGGTINQVGNITTTASSGTAVNLSATGSTSGNVIQSATAGIINSNAGAAVSVTAKNASAATINLGGSANNFKGNLTLANSNTSGTLGLSLYNAGYITTLPVTITSLGTLKLSGATLNLPNLTAGLSTVLGNLTNSGNIGSASTYDLYVNTPSYTTGLDYSAASNWQLRNLTLLTAGGIALTQSNNLLTSATLSGTNIAVNNNQALTLGAINATGNLTVDTSTSSTGNITQAIGVGGISAGGTTTLKAANTANITVNNTTNNFSTLNFTGGQNVNVKDINGINLGTITAAGTFYLNTTGPILQNGNAITVAGVSTLNSGGSNITLNGANNDFATLNATGAAINFTELNSLILNSINGTGAITIAAQNGTLTLTSVANIALSGSQNLTLAAGTFVNNSANPITLNGGAWNIYITSLYNNNVYGPNSNQLLVSNNNAVWGTTYPTAITETGNRYIYSDGQTLSLIPTNSPFALSKEYGTTVTLPTPNADPQNGTVNYRIGGFVDAAAYGNLAFTSLGTPTTAFVNGGVPYSVTMTGSLNTSVGVLTATTPTTSFGTVTVTPVNLTITAADNNKIYGDNNPTFTSSQTAGTVVSGQTLSTGAVNSSATNTSNIGHYPIVPSGATVTANGTDVTANYNITYVNGDFTITTRPITVTANTGSMVYGDPVPTNVGGTGNNFVSGQSLYSVTVTPNATSTSNVGTGYQSAASNAVIYNASNVDVTSNYDINYVAGAFSVNARPITVGTTGTSEYGNVIVTNGAAVVSGMGLVNGNTISSVNLATNTNTMSNVASTYNTTASNAVFSTGDANNYSITYESNRPNSYVITPALLTITANDASKAAGRSNPVFTSSYSGFKNSQDESVCIYNQTMQVLECRSE